jgi:hypothetical protein
VQIERVQIERVQIERVQIERKTGRGMHDSSAHRRPYPSPTPLMRA